MNKISFFFEASYPLCGQTVYLNAFPTAYEFKLTFLKQKIAQRVPPNFRHIIFTRNPVLYDTRRNKPLIMKPSTSFLALLLSAFTSSFSLSCFGDQQTILNDQKAISGNHTGIDLYPCDDPKKYTIDIKSADISVK